MREIETPRLILRPFREEDINFLDELHSDMDVMRYLTGRVRSHEENREFLDTVMNWYATEGVGLYLVERKADSRPIGRCGFNFFYGYEQDGIEHYAWGPLYDGPEGPEKLVKREIGYTFAKKFWGQGYASEAATAVRDYGFDACGFPNICSLIMKENTASVAVAKRMGFRYAGDLYVHGQPAAEYRMTRKEWMECRKEGHKDQ
ncbi:GNAT family N-acetyltransferase [Luteithermobacter gelatinilyticus]|uniref:GNAT family N-acetyltransferase n=1 Tax=Luteithermobacter gelatinilyticus TaxID=2582913 RepID=UPI00143D8CB3|nr:GNAT family N-acetyltransferase [Luteithermobacter gelatinilyticus]